MTQFRSKIRQQICSNDFSSSMRNLRLLFSVDRCSLSVAGRQQRKNHSISLIINRIFSSKTTSHLLLFCVGTMHYLLTSLLTHKCSSFSIDVNLQSFSLRQLISVASSFVFQLRNNCTGCMLWRNSISIAELAHLLVQDKNNRWTLAIDLSVYSRNQQFRCFDCVKIGKQNRLISFESLINASVQISSYTHTLLSSLITYSPTADALNILHLENSQFLIGHALINSTPVPMTNHSHYYHNIHPYVSNSAANSHPPPPQQRPPDSRTERFDEDNSPSGCIHVDEYAVPLIHQRDYHQRSRPSWLYPISCSWI